MSDNEKAEVMGKKRSWFFYVKILLVFVLLISLSLVIAVYYVTSQLMKDSKLEKMITAKVSAETGMSVSFDKLEFSFPGFTIKNLKLATDSQELKLDAQVGSIYLRPDIFAALQRQIMIETLAVEDVDLSIFKPRTPADDEQPDSAADAATMTDLAAMAFPFKNVSINRMNLKYSDGSESYHAYVATANLGRSMLTSSLPFDLEAELKPLAKVSLTGRLGWPDTVSADINVTSNDVAELKKLVPEEYAQYATLIDAAEVRVALNYKMGGELKLESFKVLAPPHIEVSGAALVSSFSPFNAQADLRLEPVQLATFMPFAEPFMPADHKVAITAGQISAVAKVELVDAELKDFSATLKPQSVVVNSDKLQSPVTISQSELVYDNGSLKLGATAATFAGSAIKLSQGKLELEPLSFSAQMSADVDFDTTWKELSSMLPAEVLRVTPGGKLAYKGSLSYKADDLLVSGKLSSALISLLERETKASARIEQLDVDFDNFRPLAENKGRIQVNGLEIKGAGASVATNGSVAFTVDPAFDITAQGNLNLSEFSRLAAGLFKLPVGPDQFGGDISLNMKIGGSLSELKPSGELGLKNVRASLPDSGLKVENLAGTLSADADKLVIDSLTAKMVGGTLSISGSLKDFKKPVVDASGSVRGVSLAEIREFLGKNFPDMPAEIEFSGAADMNVAIKGHIAEPKVTGDATLTGARFFHPAVLRPIEKINGPITFDNDGFRANRVAANWGSSRVQVVGRLSDWTKFISDFRYQVDPVDVDDAAGFFIKDTGYVVTGKGTGFGIITGPVAEIRVGGTATVPSGLFTAPVSEGGDVFKFPYTNLVADFAYQDGVFDVSSASVKIFEGQIRATGKMFVASDPISFEFDTNMQNVQAQGFLKQNSKYPDMVAGGISGSFKAGGNTLGLKTLNGNAALQMASGTYNSPPIMHRISEQLRAPQLASGIIQNASGKYALSNGRITARDTLIKAAEGQMGFEGSIGLDASIDGTAELKVGRAIALKDNYMKQLIGREEFLVIPITLKGSLISPSVGMPLDKMLKDAVERRARDAFGDKAKEALDGLLGGSSRQQPDAPATQTPASAETPKASPVKKIEQEIKDLGKDLRNIFRR